MTEVYDTYENDIAERINRILKDEFDIGEGFINLQQASKEIKYAIETYNSFRPHFSCQMLTPQLAQNFGSYTLKKWGGRKRYRTQKMESL